MKLLRPTPATGWSLPISHATCQMSERPLPPPLNEVTRCHAPGEVVNVASGKTASLLELIALIKNAVGPAAAQLDPEHQPNRAGDLRASSADLRKARAVLGYEPRITLAEGLAGVVESWRAAIARAG